MNKPTSELTLRELIEQNRRDGNQAGLDRGFEFSGLQSSSRVAVSWWVSPPAHSC